MSIKEIVAKILKDKREVDSLFFVGCGGSFAVHYDAKYFVERESKTLKTGMYPSNEFVYATPAAVGEKSVVVFCSMRGTAETGEAVKAAKKRGATTVSVYVEESEMTRASDYTIKYNSISFDEFPIETSNGVLILEFAVEFVHQHEGFDGYEAFQYGRKVLDRIYREAKELVRPEAKRFAQECKDEKLIYVMGAGPCTYAAYTFSICNLMEMQWIHSPTVNFGELLHGPFETVDENLPIVCLLSEGRTRPVDLRGMRFLEKYGKRLYVVDSAKIGLDKIDERVREYFCPAIITSVMQNVYLHELAEVRSHPIKTRRYMWKVEY